MDKEIDTTRVKHAKAVSDFLSKEILVPGSYGKFTVTVQNGKVISLKYERSYLLDDLSTIDKSN